MIHRLPLLTTLVVGALMAVLLEAAQNPLLRQRIAGLHQQADLLLQALDNNRYQQFEDRLTQTNALLKDIGSLYRQSEAEVKEGEEAKEQAFTIGGEVSAEELTRLLQALPQEPPKAKGTRTKEQSVAHLAGEYVTHRFNTTLATPNLKIGEDATQDIDVQIISIESPLGRGNISSFALSHDNNFLITAYNQGSNMSKIEKWNTKSGDFLGVIIEGKNAWSSCVTLSADDKLIANEAGVFDLKTGKTACTLRIKQISTGRKIEYSEVPGVEVHSVAFGTDNAMLVTGGTEGLSNQGAVRLWNAKDGNFKSKLRDSDQGGAVYSVAISSDSSFIIAGYEDGLVRLWENAGMWSGWQLKHTFGGHTGAIKSVAISADNKYIVTGSKDTTARLWDVNAGNTILKFEGHTGPINSVTISKDGKYVVTGSDDETARAWDAHTGASLNVLPGNRKKVTSVAISNDNSFIVTVSGEVARIWRLLYPAHAQQKQKKESPEETADYLDWFLDRVS